MNLYVQIRWIESADTLDQKLKGVVGDTLVSAGVVAYQGAFTSKYRKDLTLSWVNLCNYNSIPISSGYDFIKDMATANQVDKSVLLRISFHVVFMVFNYFCVRKWSIFKHILRRY